jgi:hypothetical protein
MRQRATAGGERPRWSVVSQSLGVHPDHGVHTLLAQPLQDQKRYGLDAAFLIDFRPTAWECSMIGGSDDQGDA